MNIKLKSKFSSVLPILSRYVARSTTKEEVEANTFVGHLDTYGAGQARGWVAQALQLDTSTKISVKIDDTYTVHTIADIERGDLRDAGFGNGRHGFDITIPKRLQAETNTVEILASMDGETLSVIKQTYEDYTESNDGSTISVHLDITDLLMFISHHRDVSGIQRVQVGYIIHLVNSSSDTIRYKVCGRFSGDIKFYDINPSKLIEVLQDAADRVKVPELSWLDYLHRFRLAISKLSNFSRNDVLMTLGAPWAIADHTLMIASLKRRYGIRYFQVFYDLIPLSDPEYVSEDLIPVFAESTAAMAVYADHVFSISRHSGSELDQICRYAGVSTPPISVIPMGSGVDYDLDQAVKPSPMHEGHRLNIDDLGEFVLCVGTVEPRKNHTLLYNVWKKLLSTHKFDDLPKLVLVGRMGWHMDDLKRKLRVSGYLDGLVVHLSDVGDMDLARLYDRCLFTVFPSFTEGWGLPIIESLNHGKLCVCSNTTAMPEAGGDHVVYIDPHSFDDCYTSIARLIDDRSALSDLNAKVLSDYKPISWRSAALSFDQLIRQAVEGTKHRPDVANRQSVKLDELYSIGHRSSIFTPKAQFIEGIKLITMQESRDGPLWFEPEGWGCWCATGAAQLRLRFDANVLEDLCCYLRIAVAGWSVSNTISVAVDGRYSGTVGFTDPENSEVRIDLNAVSSAGSAPREHVLTLSLDQRHPVWNHTVAGNDPRVLGIGVKTLFVCRNTPEARLTYVERGIMGVPGGN